MSFRVLSSCLSLGVQTRLTAYEFIAISELRRLSFDERDLALPDYWGRMIVDPIKFVKDSFFEIILLNCTIIPEFYD